MTVGLYRHQPHPHVAARTGAGPAKVADQHPRRTRWQRFNTRLALRVTLLVGTMLCAYAFGALALVSLPSALASGNLTVIIAWLSSNFLQLVLLPVIIVGQNAQAKAADQRAADTFRDVEAILHELAGVHAHLDAQDEHVQATSPQT